MAAKGRWGRSVNDATSSADKAITGPVSRESITQKPGASRLVGANPETLSRRLCLVAIHHSMISGIRSMEIHARPESDVAQGNGLSPESNQVLEPTSHVRGKR